MADPQSSTARTGPPTGPTARPDLSALRRDLEAGVQGTVALDAGTLALYTSDASNYRRVPLAVVIPET
ncbi:MAG: hypothetical protein JK586_13685, partial [Nocardiopsis sp. BM-2018]